LLLGTRLARPDVQLRLDGRADQRRGPGRRRGLIAACLHAADLAGQRYTIEDVAAWVSRADQDIPDTILRNRKVSRAIHALAGYSRKEGRTENSIRIVAGAWLAWTAAWQSPSTTRTNPPIWAAVQSSSGRAATTQIRVICVASLGACRCLP